MTTKTIDSVLTDVINGHIRKSMMEKYFFNLPARVDSIVDVNKVNVEILLSKTYSNGETVKYPILRDVPVQINSWDDGDAFIRGPLKKGDTGRIVVFDRAIHSWLSGSGGVVAPDGNRIHNLSDAIFVPGTLFFSNKKTGAFDENLVAQNNISSLCLTPTGQFALIGATEELISLLVELITTLSTTTVTVPGPGVFPLNSAASLASLTTRLLTLKKV